MEVGTYYSSIFAIIYESVCGPAVLSRDCLWATRVRPTAERFGSGFRSVDASKQ